MSADILQYGMDLRIRNKTTAKVIKIEGPNTIYSKIERQKLKRQKTQGKSHQREIARNLSLPIS